MYPAHTVLQTKLELKSDHT